MEYYVPKGEKRRSVSLIVAYKLLASQDQLTEKNIHLARILAWNVEIVMFYFILFFILYYFRIYYFSVDEYIYSCIFINKRKIDIIQFFNILNLYFFLALKSLYIYDYYYYRCMQFT